MMLGKSKLLIDRSKFRGKADDRGDFESVGPSQRQAPKVVYAIAKFCHLFRGCLGKLARMGSGELYNLLRSHQLFFFNLLVSFVHFPKPKRVGKYFLIQVGDMK